MYVLVVTLLGAGLASGQPQTALVLDVYGNKGSFFNPGFPQDYRDSLDLLYTGHFNYSHPQWVRLTLEYSLDGVMPSCADYIHIIGQNFSRCGKVNSQREQHTVITDCCAHRLLAMSVPVLDLYTNAGSFTSPNFPSNYWNDLDLTYTAHLTSPGPQLLHIILDSKLEITNDICFDFVTLFFQNKNVKYCGFQNLSFDVVVDGDKLQMSFHTDFSICERGFNVTYYVIGRNSSPWTQTCTTCHVPALSSTLFTDWTDETPVTDPPLSTKVTTATLLTSLTLSTSVTSSTLSTPLTNFSDGATPIDDYRTNGIDPTTTDSLVSYGTGDNSDVIDTMLELTTRDQQPLDDVIHIVSSSYITAGDVSEGWPGGNAKVTVPSDMASSLSTTGLTPIYYSPQSIEIIARQDIDATATTASEMEVRTVNLQTQTASDVEALATITSDTDTQTTVTSDTETLTTLTSNMETQALATSDLKTQNVVTSDSTTQTVAANDTETTISVTGDKKTSATPRTELDPPDCCRCQLLGGSETGKVLNAEDREKKIDEIITTLLVDKDNVSSTKRKHISAHDSRQSAAALGLVGVVLCALPLIFVLLMDVAGFAVQAACGKKSMRAKNTVDAS
ncbi:hypothetical protein C0Q70_02073 [Pomacea canaliculata]|uniref:CUB domain-containing protein n=1 Tax=Pomacea canaliculata TaxID=400727 RepID=A0A2T7Q194_POMCA|nr:hypothetical protein C0Q70_02073 [Pomacea canaliculata]